MRILSLEAGGMQLSSTDLDSSMLVTIHQQGVSDSSKLTSEEDSPAVLAGASSESDTGICFRKNLRSDIS